MFTGVYIIFLISAQNIDCGYSLEPPRRGGSNEYPQSMFEQKYEKYHNFLSENFHFFRFYTSAQNTDCGYSLEPPRRGGSNEYPQSMFEQKYEKYQNFLSENFSFF